MNNCPERKFTLDRLETEGGLSDTSNNMAHPPLAHTGFKSTKSQRSRPAGRRNNADFVKNEWSGVRTEPGVVRNKEIEEDENTDDGTPTELKCASAAGLYTLPGTVPIVVRIDDNCHCVIEMLGCWTPSQGIL